MEFLLADQDTSADTIPSWRSRLPKSWTLAAQWRQDVQRRRLQLLDELNRLNLTTEAQRAERDYLISDLLEDANRAAQARQLLGKWWWGTEIERAWSRLREVEERIVDLLPDQELMVCVADTLEHGRSSIKGDDERVLHLEMLRREAVKTHPPTLPPDLRPAIVNVLREAHAHSDRTNQEARYLRNRLLVGSLVILAAAASLVFAQAKVPDAQFLAIPGRSVTTTVESSAPAADAPSPSANRPPASGDPSMEPLAAAARSAAVAAESLAAAAKSAASAADSLASAASSAAAPTDSPDSAKAGRPSNAEYLMLVMLFGCVGALFTAIPAVSRVPSDFSPFNLPLQQFLLKVAFGSLTAVLGLAALSNSTDMLVKWPQTVPGILLIAMLLGAGQQAVTRYVDKRAEEILNATAPNSKALTN